MGRGWLVRPGVARSTEDDQPCHRIHATKSIWGEMTCLQIMHRTLLEIAYGFCLFWSQPHRSFKCFRLAI